RGTGQFAACAQVEHGGTRRFGNPHSAFFVGYDVAQPLERFAFEVIEQNFALRSEFAYSGRRFPLDINDAALGINGNSSRFVGIRQVKSNFAVFIYTANRVRLALLR